MGQVLTLESPECTGAVFPAKDRSGKHFYAFFTKDELIDSPRLVSDDSFRQAHIDRSPPECYDLRLRKCSGPPKEKLICQS